MADPREGVEAPLLPPPPPPSPVAGGDVNLPRAWLSETNIIWTMLSLLTVLVMCSIGCLTVGSLHYTVWIAVMANMDAMAWWTAAFTFAGDLTSLFLIYSPLNSFLEIARAGNVGGRTHIVNVATIINRSVWICYGAMLKSVNYSIVLTNITGVAFHFGYLTVYVICCRGQRAFFFKWVAIGVAFAAGIAGACFYLHSAGSNLPDVFGSCGLVTGILMYLGGAVENMAMAHWTNGAEGRTGLLATFLNATLWMVYAWIIGDTSMLIPSAAGVCLCVVQFTQLFVYRFWMPAGELQARLLSAFNTMMARAPLVEASGEGLSAAAAANQTAPAVAATDIIGGQP